MIFTKSEPPQRAHPGPGGREPSSSQRLRFPRKPIPVPAQGSLPTRAAQVGDGRIDVRKLNIRVKPQTITSLGARRLPTKLASSHCGHQSICPWLLRQWARIAAAGKEKLPDLGIKIHLILTQLCGSAIALRLLILRRARELWRGTLK